MVVVLDRGISAQHKRAVREFLSEHRYQIRELLQDGAPIMGAVGGDPLDHRHIEVLPGVAQVIPLSQPYKLASREFKRTETVIAIGPIKIGGGRLAVIAGPCAVESREQIFDIAAQLRESGAVGLRGGAFKPRTSPYSFQGLGKPGVETAQGSGRALRHADLVRGDGRGAPADARRLRGRAADRRAQHAEFRVAQAGGRARQAGAAQARPGPPPSRTC